MLIGQRNEGKMNSYLLKIMNSRIRTGGILLPVVLGVRCEVILPNMNEYEMLY